MQSAGLINSRISGMFLSFLLDLQVLSSCFLDFTQVRLPWQRLQSKCLPPSNRRDRLLHCLCCGSVQLRGTNSETLPGTYWLCQVVRNHMHTLTHLLLCYWWWQAGVIISPCLLIVWPFTLIRSGLLRDRLQEWTKMDGWEQTLHVWLNSNVEFWGMQSIINIRTMTVHD